MGKICTLEYCCPGCRLIFYSLQAIK